jgi:hypothetical protein
VQPQQQQQQQQPHPPLPPPPMQPQLQQQQPASLPGPQPVITLVVRPQQGSRYMPPPLRNAADSIRQQGRPWRHEHSPPASPRAGPSQASPSTTSVRGGAPPPQQLPVQTAPGSRDGLPPVGTWVQRGCLFGLVFAHVTDVNKRTGQTGWTMPRVVWGSGGWHDVADYNAAAVPLIQVPAAAVPEATVMAVTRFLDYGESPEKVTTALSDMVSFNRLHRQRTPRLRPAPEHALSRAHLSFAAAHRPAGPGSTAGSTAGSDVYGGGTAGDEFDDLMETAMYDHSSGEPRRRATHQHAASATLQQQRPPVNGRRGPARW